MNKVYIRDYSRKEIAVLLSECFFIIGKSTDNLNSFQIETMINGVLKYNGGMWYDSFKEAFEMAIDLNVDTYGSPTPAIIMKALKAYKNKDGVNVRTHKNENPSPHGLPPATDKDYYETLICIMVGKRSHRHKMAYPHISDENHLQNFNKYGQMIPMLYGWDNVYSHLRTLNQVDDIGDNFYKQKTEVIKWLFIKYPNAKLQSEMFDKSPIGQSVNNSPRSRAEQLRDNFWHK